MAYKVTVAYDNKQLIPAPFITIKPVFQRSGDGSKRTAVWSIQLKGKLTADRGSPDPSIDNGDDDPVLSTFWTSSGYPPGPNSSDTVADKRVARLRDKMAALTKLFKQDGLWFEITPGDSSDPIRFQPRIGEIDFADGMWFNYVDYLIPMEAEVVWFGQTDQTAGDLLQDDNAPEESWGLDPIDQEGRHYKLTHTVTAVGRKRYNEDGSGSVAAEGWEVAKDLILGTGLVTNGASKLGFQSQFLAAAGVLDLSSHQPYNYVRTQQADVAGGKFAVIESWFCMDPSETVSGQTAGKAFEEITVETRGSLEGYTVVSVNGTITGVEERNSTTYALATTRWTNASLRADAVLGSPTVAQTLAETYTGVTLNPTPVSTTVSRNKITGVVQFSTQFDTRPANSDSSYLTESYTVTFDNPANIVAEIGVVQRPTGPILQPVGSKTRSAVTVEASITKRAQYGTALPSPPAPDMQALALAAIGTVPSQFYLIADRPVWNDRQGRYSRTSTFLYEL